YDPSNKDAVAALVSYVASFQEADPETRVRAFNFATSLLSGLVADLIDAPCLGVQLLPAAEVRANTYNPNRVAVPELDLLEQSIRCDGVTMPVVVHHEAPDTFEVVDGFHRRKTI